MAKRKPRRKRRKYKTEDILGDFRRLPHDERVRTLKRMEQRLRRAGLLVIILLAAFGIFLLAQLL